MSDRVYPIFLSSLCDHQPGLRELRARIYYDIGHEAQIYVYEKIHPELVPEQELLSVADELIARVRQADHFICILAGKSHGSPIKHGHAELSTSFLEIELVQAALLRKRIHVLVREGFEPEPRLEALLRILADAFPSWRTLKPLTEAKIFEQIARIADRTSSPLSLIPAFALPAPISRLVQALYAARARHRPDPSIDFLRETFDPALSDRRIERIPALLLDIARQHSEEKKLARLWIALRELAAIDFHVSRDPVVLQHANTLLAEWSRAGAWYGLHGDLRLGCLAALNSLVEVRARLVALAQHGSNPGPVEYPGGALASAKYSIARRLIIKSDRVARFNAALADIQQSLDNHDSDRSGLLAIRGSIQRQLGHKSDAIADYEETLRLRLESGARVAAIGDAMSELGYAHLLNGSPRVGLRYCEEGIEKLREGGNSGFLARGLKKLALAYLLSGRLARARNAWEEARAVAQAKGALDQL